MHLLLFHWIHRKVKSVFLGAVPRNDGTSYQWLDDTRMNFTNWAANRGEYSHPLDVQKMLSERPKHVI